MANNDKIEEHSEGIENITLEQFIDLVKDYESTDPIDFGTVPVKEDDAFRAICEGVLMTLRSTPENERVIVLMVALAKVLLEAEIQKLQTIQYLKPLSF